MKKIFSQFRVLVSLSLVFVMVLMTAVGLLPQTATAASITSAKATLGRLKASTANEFGTIEFATPTGI